MLNEARQRLSNVAKDSSRYPALMDGLVLQVRRSSLYDAHLVLKSKGCVPVWNIIYVSSYNAWHRFPSGINTVLIYPSINLPIPPSNHPSIRFNWHCPIVSVRVSTSFLSRKWPFVAANRTCKWSRSVHQIHFLLFLVELWKRMVHLCGCIKHVLCCMHRDPFKKTYPFTKQQWRTISRSASIRRTTCLQTCTYNSLPAT